jgi:hypothetical protein
MAESYKVPIHLIKRTDMMSVDRRLVAELSHGSELNGCHVISTVEKRKKRGMCSISCALLSIWPQSQQRFGRKGAFSWRHQNTIDFESWGGRDVHMGVGRFGAAAFSSSCSALK